jgi:hypothetical protein
MAFSGRVTFTLMASVAAFALSGPSASTQTEIVDH